jgi:hypothetical protein
MLFAGVAFGQGTATVWLEGDGGGNTVTVAIGGSAVMELWFSYASVDEGGNFNRLSGFDAQLRHNGFSTGNPTWNAQDGDDFEVTHLNGQGPWGDLAEPLTFGNHGGMGNGALLPADVYGGNLNPTDSIGVEGEQYQFAAGSDIGNAGLAGSATSWFADEIVIRGITQNWDGILLTGTPDTVNFPKRGNSLNPEMYENIYYNSTWDNGVPQPMDQGVGAAANRMYVRVTPEPTSLALLAIGGLAALRRRR